MAIVKNVQIITFQILADQNVNWKLIALWLSLQPKTENVKSVQISKNKLVTIFLALSRNVQTSKELLEMQHVRTAQEIKQHLKIGKHVSQKRIPYVKDKKELMHEVNVFSVHHIKKDVVVIKEDVVILNVVLIVGLLLSKLLVTHVQDMKRLFQMWRHVKDPCVPPDK